MNFLITVNVDSDSALEFSKKFGEFCEGLNLSSKETLVENTHTLILVNKKVLASESVDSSDELSPEEAKETPALNETDLCPMCGEKECDCPERNHKCDKCKEEKPCDECGKEHVEETLVKEFDPVKILTLSTSTEVPTIVKSGQKNTVLQVKSVMSEDSIVRFSFNSYEHAFPLQEHDERVQIINRDQEVGSTTVRLVLNFSGKTYPCLVDIVEGQSDTLIIGESLFEMIQKDRLDVQTK